jgi:hypothetical protein
VTVTGTVLVASECSELGNNIVGSSLVIKDESGTILGSYTIDTSGKPEREYFCSHYFEFPDVPTTASQYTISTNNGGGVTQSRSQMEQNNWFVELSIGF